MRFIVTLLFFGALNASAQVKLLTLDKLEQRIAKGQDTIYVVNFWATWCGPCVEELPYFEKLNHAYQDKPIKVILMSMDFKSKLEKEVIPFVKKHKLSSETYVLNEVDTQAAIKRIDRKWSGAIPATWFITRDRRVNTLVEKGFTYADLTNTLISLK
jgi:thiol-disulfide isomerase/thioredoxin